ncbi:MAG: DUF503 domain-containing protein [Deltaproteobacteria bacterium]|nr:DUF503 domain-containing protein [Deltaproteobacteria bacterium]
MVVAYGTVALRLPENHSLKGKRKVVKAVIGRIRSNFNASVAETGDNDMHQRAEIGFALVSNSSQLANSKMDRIINLIEQMGICEVMDADMEIMVV